jgi:GNAT superfamily N-acetyltransferase
MTAVAGMTLRIVPRPLDHTDVAGIVDAVQQLYTRLYGGGDEDADPAQFVPPAGLFLVSYEGDTPVGSGGWRRLAGAGTVEVKRMYVVEAARGKGYARRMLAELESTARAAGARRVLLTTGFRQPGAIALYDSSGYRRTDERFGRYAETEGAVFFAKNL